MTARIKHSLFILTLTVLILLSLNIPLCAQRSSSTIDSLLSLGNTSLAQRQFRVADEAFKKLLKLNPEFTQAIAGLGRSAFAQGKWQNASEYFNQLLEQQPNQIEAKYYLGIAYREMGKYKALLLRKLDWDKATKHFRQAIAQDSLYQDILYQYALLKRYQNHYTEAILLGHRQVQLRPELAEPQVGLFKLYGFLIRHQNGAQVINWLAQQNNDHARYFIGEKLRRDKKFITADSLLHLSLTHSLSIPTAPIYLSLAKIYYKLEQPNNAEQCYWEAVDEIQNQLAADLNFEEIKYLVTDAELTQYHRLSTVAGWRDFYRSFWVNRNPLPSTNNNLRLEEHYRRLLTAEEYYEFDGFRTWFNNPDKYHYLRFPQTYTLNQEFNDKGMIFIRLGEPNDFETTAGEDVQTNESWFYKGSQTLPEMTFHFVKENAAGNNWRFTPYLTDPKMLEDRMQWDPNYSQMLQANPTERILLQQKMAEESKASVMTGLTTERQTWQKNFKPFDLPFSFLTFRGEQGNTLVEVTYTIPMALLKQTLANGNWQAALESGLALHNRSGRAVFKKTENFALRQSEATTAGWYDFYRLSVPPDSYHVAIHARLKGSNLLGGYQFDQQIADYRHPELALSDILLADNIKPSTGDSKFSKNSYNIIPNPTGQFTLSRPVCIYFEIYHLQQSQQSNAAFNIEYKLSCQKLHLAGIKKYFGWLSSSEHSSISIQNSREGAAEASVEVLAIDVSRLQPGEYELTVKVTDRQNQDKSVQKTTRLVLAR